jgi:hypothetical protein
VADLAAFDLARYGSLWTAPLGGFLLLTVIPVFTVSGAAHFVQAMAARRVARFTLVPAWWAGCGASQCLDTVVRSLPGFDPSRNSHKMALRFGRERVWWNDW